MLQRGGEDDDASDSDNPTPNAQSPAKKAKSPAKKTKSPAKQRTISDYRLWLPYKPEAVAWNDLGFSDEGAREHEDFMPACAFFFYIAILPQKFANVNNTLHAVWQTKHKKPMSAEDLAEPPLSFDEQAQMWYKQPSTTC